MSDYSMDDFRKRMIERGVYKNGRTVKTAEEQKKPRGRMGGRHESARALFARTVAAARARIAELESQPLTIALPCPRISWGKCPATCCCGGLGNVLVADTIKRYRRIVVEYQRLGAGA